jgi:CrcB protein
MVQTMQFGVLLAVAVGGGLGSLLRYFVAGAIQSAAWPGYPWGIFIVNITGGLAMGIIVEMAALKISMTPEVRSFLTVGVLGGYTTFSTFSLDSVLLIQRGAYASAAAYIVGSVVLSILALFAGLWLVRTI